MSKAKHNLESVGKELAKDFDSKEVSVFVSYINELKNQKNKDGSLKYKWSYYLTDEILIDLYSKVSIDKLYIDGETVTLEYKGKVNVVYNYQAYKNRVLRAYPESKFDMQNVYNKDEFEFSKENGKVNYKHQIKSAFSNDKKIIGCYCIIKNKRGEFIETLNRSEIEKMRNAAKFDGIWKNWFGEMALKSVIKRSCKRHFKDITSNMDNIDNESYDLEKIDIEKDLQTQISEVEKTDDLKKIYKDNKDTVEDLDNFLLMLTEKRLEIQNNENENI